MTIQKPERTPPKARKRIARGPNMSGLAWDDSLCRFVRVAPARKRKPLKRARIAKRPKASRKKAVLYADSLWSQIVRRREGGCVSGRPNHAGGFQAAHGFSRRYYGTRWNLRNGFKLCAGCHVYWTHRPIEWDEWMLWKLGSDLYCDMRSTALTGEKQDMQAIISALEAVLHTGTEA